MNVLIFGATGMIGQGVLLECLRDPDVQMIRTVGRKAIGKQDSKLRETVLPDLTKYSSVEADLKGFDACFFCLGVSSAGMKEAGYEAITYGITMAAAETLVRLNPEMTFIYVSGASADSTERGRIMWARVKGRTENALLKMPFKAAYMFRPGVIQPLDGIQSRTPAYRILYKLTAPLLPLIRRMLGESFLTTRQIGRAMLILARQGSTKHIFESKDIWRIAEGKG